MRKEDVGGEERVRAALEDRPLDRRQLPDDLERVVERVAGHVRAQLEHQRVVEGQHQQDEEQRRQGVGKAGTGLGNGRWPSVSNSDHWIKPADQGLQSKEVTQPAFNLLFKEFRQVTKITVNDRRGQSH